ncbi:FliH/SctL family protein [Thermanaerothrix sp. 4228-RoL]|uniref:FliH/SctL family protein n=1 Tax=Thermanaerothrix solaris TaxID=3058434 RepID=A0ABU3NLF4_9CHLR|nr:FliH/SctL family protein [Thermanaerothrix sp. 4228-RoL]MDT8897683.1 FliH/SctL family protein [Thermanaerothrix sp. 4228-RoL]
MKLFSDPYQPRVRSEARPWQPPALTTEASLEPPEALVEQILTIFSPHALDVSSAGFSRANGRRAQTKVQIWTPVDLMAMTDEDTNFESTVNNEQSDPDTLVSSQVDLTVAQAEANALLAEAQAQAEALLREAQAQAEQLRQQAYAQGRAEAEAELRDLLRTVSTMVQETRSWHETFLAQSEPLVLEMVAAIARALFSEGFALDAETLQQTYTRVLEHARALGDLRIYVNPEDARLLDPYWKEAQAALRDQRIKLIPSESIRRGGCFVEGQYGAVDGRIEVRLERLLTSLIQETQPEGTGA